MTLWDAVIEANTATTPLWKPFKSWIMLMLVQFDAADTLCNFVAYMPDLSSAAMNVKIVYSPVISDTTIPLEVLMTKYIPALGDPQTNAKLEDLSLPRVFHAESARIRGIHGFSTDSMVNPQYFFLAVGPLKFGIQSMDSPWTFNEFILFYLIFMESIWTVHGQSTDSTWMESAECPWIIRG